MVETARFNYKKIGQLICPIFFLPQYHYFALRAGNFSLMRAALPVKPRK